MVRYRRLLALASCDLEDIANGIDPEFEKNRITSTGAGK
jgi:hypothetical protein